MLKSSAHWFSSVWVDFKITLFCVCKPEPGAVCRTPIWSDLYCINTQCTKLQAGCECRWAVSAVFLVIIWVFYVRNLYQKWHQFSLLQIHHLIKMETAVLNVWCEYSKFELLNCQTELFFSFCIKLHVKCGVFTSRRAVFPFNMPIIELFISPLVFLLAFPTYIL